MDAGLVIVAPAPYMVRKLEKRFKNFLAGPCTPSGDEPQIVTHHVHDAQLDPYFRIYRVNGVR